MKTSPEGVRFVRREESCVLHIYPDQKGKATIGWGHLLSDDDKRTGRFALGLTQRQADDLFAADLDRFERAIEKYIRVPLRPNEHAALVSLAFNCGEKPLWHDVGPALNRGDVAEAMKQWATWRTSDGVVLDVLVRRRAAEIAMFRGNASR